MLSECLGYPRGWLTYLIYFISLYTFALHSLRMSMLSYTEWPNEHTELFHMSIFVLFCMHCVRLSTSKTKLGMNKCSINSLIRPSYEISIATYAALPLTLTQVSQPGPKNPTPAMQMLADHCTSGKRTAISPDCVIYLTQGSEGYCN